MNYLPRILGLLMLSPAPTQLTSPAGTPSQRLDIHDPEHVARAAEMIEQGEIIVAGFNGIFGIFGDADNPNVAEKINLVKGRDPHRRLIIVSAPEFLHEQVDTQSPIMLSDNRLEKIQQLSLRLHALGAILPAHPHTAPSHLVKDNTILNIWTEYLPLRPMRALIGQVRQRGKRALAGTSANISTHPTHSDPELVYEEFNGLVPAMLLDFFEHLPEHRKKSTSIIDFTKSVPVLHRKGNVTEQELRVALREVGFPHLHVPHDALVVREHPKKK